jgi:hypothetical protein
MLRDEDLSIDFGRASHGGDFLRLTHVPTGLVRTHPGPLLGVNRRALLLTWADEIEAELKSRGKFEHIVPAYRTKSTRQKRR